MFEEKELQALLNLLNRVNIQGNEAISVVLLQQKIKKLMKPEEKQNETSGTSK